MTEAGMKQPSRPAKTASRPSVRLPAKVLAQVRAIAATVKARPRSDHKALLFCGTNAGAAAEALAKALRRDLDRVDLSAVVSKYIGETEKILPACSRAPKPPARCWFLTRPTHCSGSARR